MNFETNTRVRPQDVHLNNEADRIAQLQGLYENIYVEVDIRSAPNENSILLMMFLDNLEARGMRIIPVITPATPQVWRVSSMDWIRAHNRDIAFKIPFEIRSPFQIQRIVQSLNVKSQTHLILDLGKVYRNTFRNRNEALRQVLDGIQETEWASVTVCGGSIPKRFDVDEFSQREFPRREWHLFQQLGQSTLNFGDYGIAPPIFNDVDFRSVIPSPKLIYTTPETWLVTRGRSEERQANRQFRRLCRMTVDSPFFRGRNDSRGSQVIQEHADHDAHAGEQPSFWRTASFNQHFALVARSAP